MSPEPTFRAVRGRLLSFLRAPTGPGDTASYRYIEDGVIVVKDGRIDSVGPADDLMARPPPNIAVEHHPGALIMPGLIDPHIHLPQT